MSGYYGEQEQVQEDLLDFERAMRDFREMFPSVSSSQIELVLRKYDGDVSATINELLFEDNNTAAQTTFSGQFRSGEDVLTRLRRRRHDINEKLRQNQRLLDRVTDVESARTYEDQQLAYLLEHREISELIREEKSKLLSSCVSQHKEVPSQKPKPKLRKSETTRRSMSLEEPLPDGPYLGPAEERKNDFGSRIKETLKKASGSKLSRLFSTS
uniref:CUE domain-containing protein n=1 Tax=Caenorhabditis japonica TaxID=281687 RepID=A0A8R1E3S5_CAEJA